MIENLDAAPARGERLKEVLVEKRTETRALYRAEGGRHESGDLVIHLFRTTAGDWDPRMPDALVEAGDKAFPFFQKQMLYTPELDSPCIIVSIGRLDDWSSLFDSFLDRVDVLLGSGTDSGRKS